jgi:lipopolysaccharide biosynthesis glycosyltransferase
MNILASVNRAYVPRLNTTLHSLYMNHARREITIHLLHSELTGEDISALSRTAQRYGGALVSYPVSEEHKKISAITKDYPPEAFYRLLCTDYLPHSVRRVLYLDGDIIVNGSLESLYSLSMTRGDKRCLFAAATDPFNYTVFKLFHKQNLGLPADTDYVNSGVLLMDIELMRETTSAAEIIAKIPKYLPRLKLPDQDLLNVLFAEDIIRIDAERYNWCPSLSGSWIQDIRQGYPAVIHFAGPEKPWDPTFPTPNRASQKAKALYGYYASL